MAIIKCPECGHQVSDMAKTCPSCGIEIAGKVMKCPDCGEVVFNDLDLCPGCHHQLHTVKATRNDGAGNVGAQSSDDSVESVGVVDAPKKKKTGYTVFTVCFVIVLIAVFVGVYFYTGEQQRNELEAYENAVSSEEPAVLQTYLDMYEDAPAEHRDSVKACLDRLGKIDAEWTDAVVNGTKTAFERYMRLHPGSVHNVEAKIKIDSLDWISATQTDTRDSYRNYIDAHADGMYVDEARDRFDRMEAKRVDDTDKTEVSRLFTAFFNALATGDEAGLTSSVSPVMDDFLHKANATKSDVLDYMARIHEPEDINSIVFRPNVDWKINKQETADGGREYGVMFTVDMKIDRSDTEKETFCTYKVDAKITSDGKIGVLNMRKIVQ